MTLDKPVGRRQNFLTVLRGRKKKRCILRLVSSEFWTREVQQGGGGRRAWCDNAVYDDRPIHKHILVSNHDHQVEVSRPTPYNCLTRHLSPRYAISAKYEARICNWKFAIAPFEECLKNGDNIFTEYYNLANIWLIKEPHFHNYPPESWSTVTILHSCI